jgi:hypothetical protein
MSDERPKAGWRYVITMGFGATVMTHWNAPFTSGEHKFLQKGLEFVILEGPPETAKAVGARPEPYEQWEAQLIAEEDRQAEKYAGCSLSIPLIHLAKRCTRL